MIAKRILVCGGRAYKDSTRVGEVLDAVAKKYEVTAVIQGEAAGADSLAAAWARRRGVLVVGFKADWSTHGRAAGPRRNQRMLNEGRPDAVIAFPGGSGTANMIRKARAAGLPVWLV
jgi:predicted polyphosphate/ATP-dependent NAD kinase